MDASVWLHQSVGEVRVGPERQSRCVPEESLEYRYFCVNVCPVFTYYSECTSGVGAVSGDKGWLVLFALFLLLLFVFVFPLGSYCEFYFLE